MTDEKVAETAVEQVAKDAVSDVKADAPGVIAHLEAYAHWTEAEIEAAYAWLKAKL